MQLNADLTLERAITMAHQSKAIHKQQGIVKGTAQDSSKTLDSEVLIKLQKNIPSMPTRLRKTNQHLEGNHFLTLGNSSLRMKTNAQCPAKDPECHRYHK